MIKDEWRIEVWQWTDFQLDVWNRCRFHWPGRLASLGRCSPVAPRRFQWPRPTWPSQGSVGRVSNKQFKLINDLITNKHNTSWIFIQINYSNHQCRSQSTYHQNQDTNLHLSDIIILIIIPNHNQTINN